MPHGGGVCLRLLRSKAIGLLVVDTAVSAGGLTKTLDGLGLGVCVEECCDASKYPAPNGHRRMYV